MSRKGGSLEATFEVLSEEELDRVTATYAPLTDAVRDLIDATVRTQADDDLIQQARTAIEAVTRSLLSQRTRPPGVSYRVDGRPLPLVEMHGLLALMDDVIFARGAAIDRARELARGTKK